MSSQNDGPGSPDAPACGIAEGLKPAVVIAATLDTKGAQVAFLRDRLIARGVSVLLVDCGIRPALTDLRPEIGAADVARAAGSDITTIRAAPERAPALRLMLAGLENMVRDLQKRGLIRGFIGVGGGTNAALAGRAFSVLPYGVPKILVSTAASGDTRPFIEGSDAVLIHPVVDFVGLNGPLRASLERAAVTMAAMLPIPFWCDDAGKTIIGMTTVGATTSAAETAAVFLRDCGWESYVFHARGPGGVALEHLAGQGRISAVFDLATTEISDEVLGGMRSAGAGRLDAAIAARLPQVIAPGAVDLVNFSGPETVPDRYRARQLISHTPASTLMRASAAELREVGAWIGGKLAAARAPVSVFLPMGGFSSYDRPGSDFADPASREGFAEGLADALRARPDISIEYSPLHINDPEFVRAACERLRDYLQAAPPARQGKGKTNGTSV